jgi:hypothetical protein
MKCKSCQEDVPPKFSHAIEQNICPMCGDEIMDAELKVILINLKDCLSNISKYETEIEDYLLSKYSFKKIKNDEIIVNKDKAIEKVKEVIKAEEIKTPKIAITPANNEFFKRAGVKEHKKAIDFIQGDVEEYEENYEQEEIEDDIIVNQNPLNRNEELQMKDIFEQENKKLPQQSELNKLKKLHGGNGAFRRV